MECRASVPRALGLNALAIGITAGCYLLAGIREPIPVIVGWCGVVFFGFCAVKIFFQTLRGGPRIIVSDLGIDDQRGGLGLIRWEDVQAVWIQYMGANRFMCVDVRDPNRYLANLPWYSRWPARANPILGFSKLTLNFCVLTPGLDEAMAFIRSRHVQDMDNLHLEVTNGRINLWGSVGPDLILNCQDMQSLSILTTDEGPSKPDVFWVLRSNADECVIPNEADLDGKLIEAFQQLPGFDNEVVAEAMGSTSCAEFECWSLSTTAEN